MSFTALILLISSSSRNYAATTVVLQFLSSILVGCALLAGLDFYFVALSYIIVYIGAIAILFLFIIMTVRLPALERQHSNLPTYQGGGALLTLLMVVSNQSSENTVLGVSNPSDWSTLSYCHLDMGSLGIQLLNGGSLLLIMLAYIQTFSLIGLLALLKTG